MIDFDALAKSYTAPIYLFNQKIPPKEGEKLSINGTITLFRKEDKLYGITNYHLYKGDEIDKFKRRSSGNWVYQIGNCPILLENRIFHEDENNDLIVFSLSDEELAKIRTQNDPKSGFRIIDNRLPEYLVGQDNNDPKTWLTHCAGYPGQDKVTNRFSDKEYEENFGFHYFFARATCEKNEIFLDYSALKESGKKPERGNFTEGNMNFGGMSGGPVFGRTQSNPNDLSLFGIIYDGSGKGCSLELIRARPISLLEGILK